MSSRACSYLQKIPFALYHANTSAHAVGHADKRGNDACLPCLHVSGYRDRAHENTIIYYLVARRAPTGVFFFGPEMHRLSRLHLCVPFIAYVCASTASLQGILSSVKELMLQAVYAQCSDPQVVGPIISEWDRSPVESYYRLVRAVCVFLRSLCIGANRP